VSVTVVATVGGALSNAYLDTDPAQALLDGVPNTSAWTVASDDQKSVALVYATRLLDAVIYKGAKASVAQALSWPRAYVVDPSYSTVGGNSGPFGIMLDTWPGYLSILLIPVRIQWATAQLALEILRAGTADVWGVDAALDVKRKQVDVLSTEYYDRPQRLLGLRKYPNVYREIYPLTLASEPRSVQRA